MKQEKAEIYLPVVTGSSQELFGRDRMLSTFREKGHIGGFMLVPRGEKYLAYNGRREQLDALDPFVGRSFLERPRVFIHHSNKPLGERGYNLLTNPEWSRDYVASSIELAAMIPKELVPESGRAVNIHLNTLVAPDRWVTSDSYWKKEFERVVGTIKELTAFASERNVTLAIETTPVPEFGDIPRIPDNRTAEDVYWADLGNPWALLLWRPEGIVKLRGVGCNLAIDFCHSYLALDTARFAEALIKNGEDPEKILRTFKLTRADVSSVPSRRQFREHVVRNTQKGDIWHVNDAKGSYSVPPYSRGYQYFEEGVVPFEGDIPKDVLRQLIQEGLRQPIKFVIEVLEKDYSRSPNTRRALEKILQLT